jgi:hypothetical protein
VACFLLAAAACPAGANLSDPAVAADIEVARNAGGYPCIVRTRNSAGVLVACERPASRYLYGLDNVNYTWDVLGAADCNATYCLTGITGTRDVHTACLSCHAKVRAAANTRKKAAAVSSGGGANVGGAVHADAGSSEEAASPYANISAASVDHNTRARRDLIASPAVAKKGERSLTAVPTGELADAPAE